MCPGSTKGRVNPYQALLAKALERRGCEVVISYHPPDKREVRDLIASGRQVVIHIHWQHFWYAAAPHSFGAALSLLTLVARLVVLRALGFRLLWTAHNVFPHERNYPVLDYLAGLALCHFSHTVIALTQHTRRRLRRRLFLHSGVQVVPHGTYAPILAYARPRAVVRREFKVGDEETLFLFFGLIRPYKGVDLLLRAFREIPFERRARLLVVGACDVPYLYEIESRAGTDTRIALRFEYIAEAELPSIVAAADFCVFPFRDVDTTGSLVYAMDLARVCIAPRITCIDELIGPKEGLLYERGSLREALLRACALTADERLAIGAAARRRTAQFDWDGIAAETMRAAGLPQSRLEASVATAVGSSVT